MADWYFSQDGKSLGPVSTAELKELAASGKLNSADLVWKEGMANWLPAGDVKGLLAGAAPAEDVLSAPLELGAESKRRPAKEDAPPDDDDGRRTRRRDEADDEDDRPRKRRREPDDDDDRPRARRDESDEDEDDRPRRRRRSRYDEDDDDDAPVRRRRRSKQSSSSGVLLIVLAVVAGIVALGIVAAIVIVAASGTGSEPRTFNLPNGQAVSWQITFKEGSKVDIQVTSDKNSDVDLFVYDANSVLIVKDEDVSKDCFVSFITTTRQKYKVEVVNRIRIDEPARNGPNSGRVTFTESPFDPTKVAPPVPPPPAIKQPNPAPPINPPGPNPPPGPGPKKLNDIPLPSGNATFSGVLVLNDPADPKGPGQGPNKRRCKTFSYAMVAGKTYTIDMRSKALDPFLRLEDPQGFQVAMDDDSGEFLNARIVHTATKTGNYRIVATTFVGGISDRLNSR